MANGRCRVHGGASPKGVAASNFKDGRYSKYLPARLIERYDQAATDPELVNLTHEIALIDARLADLLGRVDTGEAGTLWNGAQLAYKAMRDAMIAGEQKEIVASMKTLEGFLMRGNSDYAAWNEVSNLLEQRRRLVESERRRLVEAKLTMSVEQGMLLVSALVASVREHVTDRRILAKIQDDIIRITGARNGAPALARRDES